jgi:hypothetical protein
MSPAVKDLAQVLAEAQACFTGHNLLSTATEAELRETAARFLDWWNERAGPALMALQAAEASLAPASSQRTTLQTIAALCTEENPRRYEQRLAEIQGLCTAELGKTG